ncbi:winged helix-turn-helix transcriptional regulator [Nitratiruptor sp. SB155-2]|nr:winged helix-turn-helix transcriptional regulator [Nitratiruptor sp. SB155-2]
MIKKAYENGIKQSEIANFLGLSISSISKIVKED